MLRSRGLYYAARDPVRPLNRAERLRVKLTLLLPGGRFLPVTRRVGSANDRAPIPVAGARYATCDSHACGCNAATSGERKLPNGLSPRSTSAGERWQPIFANEPAKQLNPG